MPGDIELAPSPAATRVASLRSSRLDQLLGVAVPWNEALAILSRLGFVVRTSTEGSAELEVPPHRPDVTREVDLIEEVARVRGMEAIPISLPKVRPTREDAPRETRGKTARSAGVALGLFEAVTYSFVSRAALEGLGAPPPAIVIENPLSLDHEVMRTSLLPGLFEAASRARRHGERSPRLFTVGSVFLGAAREDRLPEERQELAAVLVGERTTYLARPEPVDVWDAKGLAEGLLARMVEHAAIGVDRLVDADVPPHLHPRGAARVTVDGRPVGRLGPLHPDVLDRFDLGPAAVVVEIDLAALDEGPRRLPRYAAIARFPASTRDLAVVVDDAVSAGEVLGAVRQAAGALAVDAALFDRFVGGAIPPGKKSLAFHVVYRADDRTLTDAEVDREHAKAVAAVSSRFGATLRA